MQEIADDFQASDANGDGRLDLEEYRVFLLKAKERAAAKNQWYSRPETYADDTYALYNGMDSQQEGFTFQEWQAYMGKFMAIYREIAAADGHQVWDANFLSDLSPLWLDKISFALVRSRDQPFIK